MEGVEKQTANFDLTLGKKGSYKLIATEEDETIQIEFLPQ